MNGFAGANGVVRGTVPVANGSMRRGVAGLAAGAGLPASVSITPMSEVTIDD